MKSKILTKSGVATRMTQPAELRFSAGNGTIEGYASAFGGPSDSHGDIIAKGAFKRTIADHKREGTAPAMLWAHDQSKPIGKWTEMVEDDFGLLVKGSLNMATTAGRDAFEHLKEGDVSGLSIGFVIPKGGSKRDGATNIITDIDLLEISAVVFPANRRARVAGVKTLTSKSELVDLLREAGLARSAAQKIAHGGYAALMGHEERQEKAIALAAQIAAATAKLKEV